MKELEALVGKVVRERGERRSVCIIDACVDGEVRVDSVWFNAAQLLNEFTHPNGDPLGVKEELSADGLTLEQLKEKRAEGAGIQYYDHNGDWKNLVQNAAIDISDIEYYRVKPTIKYCKPTVSFEGRVGGEAQISFSEEEEKWVPATCYGKIEKSYIVYCLEAPEEDHLTRVFDFRMPEFSPKSPPPVGWRFGYQDSIHRFGNYTKSGRVIISELGTRFTTDEITWMDIDETI